jgi:hypothetical protein
VSEVREGRELSARVVALKGGRGIGREQTKQPLIVVIRIYVGMFSV